MSDIPGKEEVISRKTYRVSKKSSLRLRIISVILLITIFTILCAFRSQIKQISRIANYFKYTATSEATPAFSYKYLDINEEEYTKLGLTPQKPLLITQTQPEVATSQHGKRKNILHGRFLHITDIHPDEHYKEGADIEAACHKGKPKDKTRKASKYGDATLGCDSPLILMNHTMEWIRDNLKDKIDFVIWTGDNVRHDNDRLFPRTEAHIFDMNRKVSNIFHDVFHGGNELDPRHFDVPVVPSLGNNDVYPHNLFSPGPTLQTRELWTIWQNFIPEEQRHLFETGAYFFNEVIPGKLAVMSINTLYLFKSNPLVDSCDKKKDPGYKLFKWLGVTLDELRSRGMKVWLSGHVPPVPKNYDITCYRKFAIWLHEYRDVIIGGLYGHMNIDHFIPIDAQKAYKSLEQSLLSQGYEVDEQLTSLNFSTDDESEIDYDLETQYKGFGYDANDDELNVDIAARQAHPLGGKPNNKEAYMATVRKNMYADVKGKTKSGVAAERYAIINVAASVIPTFNSAIRVWEYNITGFEDTPVAAKPWGQFFENLKVKLAEKDEDEDEDEDEDDDYNFHDIDYKMIKRKKKGKKGKKKQDPSLPPKKPDSKPLGPGYTPQLFTATKFVQYYVDLEAVNKGEKEFAYEVEFTSNDETLGLKNLLVDSFVDLARRLGKPIRDKLAEEFDDEDVDTQKKIKKSKKGKGKSKKLEQLWETYLEYAFSKTGYRDPA